MTKIQTPEQFAAVGQANLEAMMSLANSAIARAERLAEGLGEDPGDRVDRTARRIAAHHPHRLVRPCRLRGCAPAEQGRAGGRGSCYHERPAIDPLRHPRIPRVVSYVLLVIVEHIKINSITLPI